MHTCNIHAICMIDCITTFDLSFLCQNKSLYRTQSILITHSVPLSIYSVTETTSLAILPGLRPSTAPEPPIIPVEEIG